MAGETRTVVLSPNSTIDFDYGRDSCSPAATQIATLALALCAGNVNKREIRPTVERTPTPSPTRQRQIDKEQLRRAEYVPQCGHLPDYGVPPEPRRAERATKQQPAKVLRRTRAAHRLRGPPFMLGYSAPPGSCNTFCIDRRPCCCPCHCE